MSRRHTMKKVTFISLICLVILAVGVCIAAAQERTLRFWIYGGAQIRDPDQKVCADFEELHPGVKVDVQVFADWPDLNRKALLAVAGGDPPDIMRVKPQLLAEFAAKGQLVPLDERIKAESVDTGQFLDVLFEKSARFRGQTYAFPFHATAPAFWYNPMLFEEAGLEGVPDTWDEVIEYGKKLTIPQKRQWGLDVEATVFHFIPYLWQAGGEYTNEDNTKVLFNSPAGEDALQFMYDCIYEHQISARPEQRSDQNLYNNRIAMWNTYSERRAVYERDHPDMKFATTVFPKRVKRTTMDMCSGIVLLSASKLQEEAWELLKFLCLDEDVQRYVMSEASMLPVRKDAIQSPPFSEDPFYQPFIWQLVNDVNARPIMPGADEMMTKLGEQLQEALYRRKGVKQALEDAEIALTEVLQRTLQQ